MNEIGRSITELDTPFLWVDLLHSPQKSFMICLII